jgi:hypothetical protein
MFAQRFMVILERKNTKQKVFSTFVRCAEGALERKFRKLEDEYSRRREKRRGKRRIGEEEKIEGKRQLQMK